MNIFKTYCNYTELTNTQKYIGYRQTALYLLDLHFSTNYSYTVTFLRMQGCH